MTPVLIGKGLLLEGSNPKIDDNTGSRYANETLFHTHTQHYPTNAVLESIHPLINVISLEANRSPKYHIGLDLVPQMEKVKVIKAPPRH